MSNCKVIALTNQKGGVGKTTTAVNLGVGLVQQGKKVLLIDADAQANLTMALGYNRPDDIPITLSTVMQNIVDDKSFDASQGIIHHGEGVDLLPSNIELSGFEVRLINAMSRERVLKTYVNEVKKNYDYVLIDCMPSLGMITINALAAADSVIIPTQPHYLSAKGLELLLRSVSMVKRQINPKLRIDGILMTMVMPRTNISKEITATVKNAYGQKIKVFDTEIPHSIRAVEATAEGKSIFAYDKSGKIAAAYVSPLDELFDRLEMVNPEHIALKYYRDYHSGSAKTLKSIQITLAARLEKFNLESLAGLTATDELDLSSLGERKVALFALIPDNDTSFNFLVSILYTQLFQQLFYLADHKYGGSLPVHCHFIMDEFANVSLPDDFDKILSVMRSRGVSVSIILQNLAQLKALFEKQWESIVGNCDEFLYLGGNEQSTHKYVSELLGKETIDTNTFGKSSGRSGNYSTNYQISGRELMTPDEVRMLDNRYALLFLRGERPVMDFKYDIMKHPNVKLTSDGGKPPYIHGEPVQAVATLVFDSDIPKNAVSVKAVSTSYELLSNEDLEEIFNI